jgi:exonuclease SbcD
MVKIVHAADFHLDSAFAALPPEKSKQRRRESRDGIERLANLVNARGADLLLLSGDLFDSGHAFRETGEALAKAFAGIRARVFIAPGNHDFYAARTPYADVDWSENVHIFKTPKIEAVDVPELNCTVYGAAFTAPDCTAELLDGFSAPDDGRVHIMTMHGETDASENRYNRITREQIGRSNLDYLALGHVHSFSGIMRVNGTAYAYPGCPEGRGFDELGDRGVICGTVSHFDTDLGFVSFARRKYNILHVDVSGREPREALLAAIPESSAADIYRIVFTGAADERGVDLRAMESLLEDRFFHCELRDETGVARDIWERAEEDSLRGLFLRRMRARFSAADENEKKTVEKAVRFGLAALDDRDI